MLPTILDGLASGAVICLMGLGVVVIYRSTRVLSFAQGTIASFAAYLYFQLAVEWKLPPLLAFILAIAGATLAGVASEQLAIHPLRNADALTRTIATLGLVLVFQVVMRTIWGGSERFVPPLVSGRLQIAGQVVGAQTLLIVILTAVVSVGLIVWYSRTLSGLALTALSDNPTSARLLSVNIRTASRQTWILASALGGLAGVLVTPLLVLNPWQMTFILVASFAAALLGGFTSLEITIAGGLLIGIVRSFVTGYTNVGGLSESLGFLAVFAVLLLRKRGRDDLSGLLNAGSAL